MRVLFVNRFFHPDHSATSQLLTDLVTELRGAGVAVAVVTGRQRIDDARARLAAREDFAGAEVHRVWSSRRGRGSVAARALDYLTFHVAAGLRLAMLCRAGDVVVAKTDPPLISVTAAVVARLRRARLVNWLHDLFPEVAVGLGMAPGRGRIIALLTRLRDWSLGVAHTNVAIGEGMAARLAALGATSARVRVIHNWCDGAEVRPRALAHHPLRKAWGLEGRFVVAYSGNMGYAHEFDTLLDAAARLADDARVVFVLIGDGVRRGDIERRVAERGLGNVVFKPYQPRARLGDSLTAADVHVVSLRPQMEGLMVPSKFYGIAAAGRGVLHVGDRGGELARLVETARCGVAVAAGDGAALAACIRDLAGDPERVHALGEAARALFERRFDRSLAMSAWRAALEAAAAVAQPLARGRS
ncbi:MAG: glycosyltransferase family 4 protein [Gammaproteobacteria bacterium]|nr:glycosyltransferase family 4 protein [Gammaproteobacteria bacterium]